MTAQQWVTELSNGTDQAFRNIKRNDVVDGLTKRLASPVEIDQANTSLCGAACLMYCLAKLKAAVYAQYVVELYQTGQATLGKLTVKPGKDCRNYKPHVNSGIHPVDWIALASLRDSENDFFDYDEPSDEVGGITMPGDLVDWFRKSGFRQDANYTNIILNKDVNCLKAAGNRQDQQHSVCLFIDANVLGSSPDPIPRVPNHWVVLTSPVIVKQKRITIRVYTWGRIKTVDLPQDLFCKKFYGYISALS
jgi:hypothetical protein